MLVYQLKSANNQLDTDWVKNIDTSVLHMDFKCVLPLFAFAGASLTSRTDLTRRTTHTAPSIL